MLKLFKNATIYRVTRKLPNLNAAALRLAMPDLPFVFCTSQDCSRTGWVMNEDNTPWMRTHKNFILIQLRNEKREVPKNVINDELQKRVDDFEQRTGVLPRRPEKMELRNEVFQALLPRAFAKSSFTQILIDTERDLIFIDTASARAAENAFALLRKTLQSLPVYPVAAETPPELTMTRWLQGNPDDVPPRLSPVSGRMTIQSVLEGGLKASLNNIERGEATDELLRANNVITSMSLHVMTEFGLSMTLTDTLQFKRLVFGQLLKDRALDDAKEEAGEQDDAVRELVDEATFMLMSAELGQAWDYVIEALGGEAKRCSKEPEAAPVTTPDQAGA
jgi:recombination associated protein RdgC